MSSLIYSQGVIGDTYTKINNDFYKEKKENGYTNDGKYYLFIELEDCFLNCFFNDKYICDSSMITPKNKTILNNYINMFNKSYVIISDNVWATSYNNNMIIVKLISFDSIPTSFTFSIINKGYKNG